MAGKHIVAFLTLMVIIQTMFVFINAQGGSEVKGDEYGCRCGPPGHHNDGATVCRKCCINVDHGKRFKGGHCTGAVCWCEHK